MGGEFAGEAGLLPGFAVGSRVAGYRLEDRVGAGGMAVVFRAWDERLGRQVALKLMAPGVAADEEFRQRFIRESRAAAAVDDPHIIPVFEAGEAGGVLFIAMRYVPGGDARSLVRRLGPLPAGRAAAIISAVASALDAAHGAGLVHRDVKPANMLVDSRPGRPDHVYLSDFGLSKGAMSSLGLTGSGQLLGTPGYSAPEQLQGRPADGRADQYSLGCAAFELLSGQIPFPRDQVAAMIWAQMSEPPPRLTSLRPDLSAAVDDVLARALAKTPDGRYANCCQFADTLCQALGLAPYHSGSIATPVGYGSPGSAGPATPDHGATVSVALTQPPGRPHRHGAPVNPALTRRRLILAGAAAATTAAAGVIAWDRTHATPRSATTGTPTTQPAKAGSVIWMSNIGQAASSLTVAAGVVYVATGITRLPRTPVKTRLYALNAKTGKRIWAFELPDAMQNLNPGEGILTAVDSVVYVVSGSGTIDGRLYALHASDGGKIWSVSGPTGTPVPVGNVVYVAGGTEMYALRVSDGSRIWASSPMDVSSGPVADGVVYVAGDGAYAVRADNGTTIWSLSADALGLSYIPPVVTGNIVCVNGYELYALGASNGSRRWAFTPRDTAPVTASAATRDTVYAGAEDGTVTALRAIDGKEKWSFLTDGAVYMTPVVADGVVYVAGKSLYALRLRDGRQIWNFRVPVQQGPVVAAGTAYMVGANGHVYALRA